MSNIQHSLLTGSELHEPKPHKDSHVDGTDDIRDATSGQKGLATSAQITKLDAIEALADVTDATNVNTAGAVMETDYDAQTIIVSVLDDDPVATTIPVANLVGRATAGDVGALTAVESRTLLNVADGADVTANNAPQAHQGDHNNGGGDALKLDDLASPDDTTDLNATTVLHGLLPKLSGSTGDRLNGLGAWVSTPPDHGVLHKSGGADAIQIDDFASPDDNTDLNVSTSAHGLAPKLDNTVTNFLNGQGGWTAPTFSEEDALTAINRQMSSYGLARDIMDYMTFRRLLWVMHDSPATTCTDLSSNDHTGTYNGGMVLGDRVNQGRVYMLDPNGTSQYISCADHADFTFGDGSTDGVMSFAAVIEVLGTGSMTILSKYSTSNTEYKLELVAGALMLKLFDYSATAYIEKTSDAVLSVGKHLIAATYDGTSAHAGITLYVDGASVAATGSLSGTYTAMEDLAAPFYACADGDGNYFTGDIGFVLIDAVEMHSLDVLMLWHTVREHYGI